MRWVGIWLITLPRQLNWGLLNEGNVVMRILIGIMASSSLLVAFERFSVHAFDLMLDRTGPQRGLSCFMAFES